jgi:hypothetical protein
MMLIKKGWRREALPWIPASMIQRFSSRRKVLGSTFLAERLKGAESYDRIAGYFFIVLWPLAVAG